MEYFVFTFVSVVAQNVLLFQLEQTEPSSCATEFVNLDLAQTRNAATNNTRLLLAPSNRNANLCTNIRMMNKKFSRFSCLKNVNVIEYNSITNAIPGSNSESHVSSRQDIVSIFVAKSLWIKIFWIRKIIWIMLYAH